MLLHAKAHTGALSLTANTFMTQEKRSRLRRMQHLALTLLGVSLALLIFSARYQSLWPWLRWVRAFAEASAIGAIADWYAVVALFRRPLGLPIPHTAIIPRNQASIGRTLGQFVSEHLLTPDNIVSRLERLDMARQLAGWLTVPANAAAVAASLTSSIPALLRAADDADLRRLFRATIVPRLLQLDAARIAAKLVERLLDADLHRVALDRGLPALDRWLLANEALLREKFAQASRYTPQFIDEYIVRKFLQGVRSLLHDVVSDPVHPLRGAFDAGLRTWTQELSQSAESREAARDWLRAAIEIWLVDEDLRRLREALASYAEADLAGSDSLLRQHAAALIVALSEGVLREQSILDRLNRAWLRLARSMTSRHGAQIASLIAEVVGGWDASEVGRRIELEIGRDLQFIRINGALVGGIVGLLLYAGTLAIGQ